LLVPRGLKLQTKVVNVTKKRYDLHHENLLGRGVLVALTTVLKRSLVSYASRYA
jgi:transposase